jgi:hypothetical protein
LPGGGPAGGGPGYANRTCELRQRQKLLFNGPCRLDHRGTTTSAYAIQLGDGRRFRFYDQGNGQLLLRDASGQWPVSYSNVNNWVSFRWADLMLMASRPMSSPNGWGPGYGTTPYGSTSAPGSVAPSTLLLQNLLNSLFR